MKASDDCIEKVFAREVLDSRGRPTVEVEVACVGGAVGRAIVPSGASTGTHEAVELRDGDRSRFGGLGVRKAVANVRQVIAPRLLRCPASDQEAIDRLLIDLDGTANKSKLGANALLGVSLACAHAAAGARRQPLWCYLADRFPGRFPDPALPLPMVNMISGGLHAGYNLEFQDFLLLPIAARSYSEALQMTVAVYHALAAVLRKHGYEGTLVGDEGGFGPKLTSNEQAVELLLEAFSAAGLQPRRDAGIALDVASSHFYRNGRYHLRNNGSTVTEFDGPGMIDLLATWVRDYPILSIEDGLAEDDWVGWQKLTQTLPQTQLIGDDLFVTNRNRLERGIRERAANAILVKVNQIGTLSETLEVIERAQRAGFRTVISARSGETEDATIADLAVATGAGQIKIGSVARSERLAKYNQLLRIEEELPVFTGWKPVAG